LTNRKLTRTPDDSTGDDVARNDPSGAELTPHMDRDFDEHTVAHVRDSVLPDAIARGDVKIVNACEDVLARYGMTVPNHVSGRWAPADVPRNEIMLREMFAHKMPDYGYQIVRSREAFPDWLLLDENGEFVYAEVEHRSSSFRTHAHDPGLCDLIVCWEHDDHKLPLPVLELFTGECFEPVTRAPKADRSTIFIGERWRHHSGMDRTRRPHKVKDRQRIVKETYQEVLQKVGSRGHAMKITAQRTGYSLSHLYALVRES
jgi:hypothetical protein